MLSRRTKHGKIDPNQPHGRATTLLIAKQLNRWLSNFEDSPERTFAVTELAAAFMSSEPIALEIGRILSDPELRALQNAMLSAISLSDNPRLHPSWVTPLNEFLRSENQDTSRIAIAAVSAMKSDLFEQTLRSISRDQSKAGILRVTALSALNSDDARLSDDAFAILLELLDGGVPSETSQAAQLISSSPLSAGESRERS